MAMVHPGLRTDNTQGRWFRLRPVGEVAEPPRRLAGAAMDRVSDRLLGRRKAAQLRRTAEAAGWLDVATALPDDPELAVSLGSVRT